MNETMCPFLRLVKTHTKHIDIRLSPRHYYNRVSCMIAFFVFFLIILFLFVFVLSVVVEGLSTLFLFLLPFLLPPSLSPV